MFRLLLGVIIALGITSTVNANTVCTENDLGDQTCVTSSGGVTTGNILNNSTIGTGNTTTTTHWSTDGDHGVHTHGNFGFTYPSGADSSGGVLAFEGDPEDNVYQDVDLVGDGHLTKDQINQGFTSTLSADVWFWNNLKNTFTMKQTITAADGTVTTQQRVIVDHDTSRNFNGGQFTNYTDTYTHTSNSQNDFTIRAEMYNDTDGTQYDSYHRGPDVDNVHLNVTTAGSTSTVVTLCHDRNPPTCTYDNTAVDNAVNLIEEDGTNILDNVEDDIQEAIDYITFDEPDFDFAPELDTYLVFEDEYGEIEEIAFDEYFETSFNDMLEEYDMEEVFIEELEMADITEEEFFEMAPEVIIDDFGGLTNEEFADMDFDDLPTLDIMPPTGMIDTMPEMEFAPEVVMIMPEEFTEEMQEEIIDEIYEEFGADTEIVFMSEEEAGFMPEPNMDMMEEPEMMEDMIMEEPKPEMMESEPEMMEEEIEVVSNEVPDERPSIEEVREEPEMTEPEPEMIEEEEFSTQEEPDMKEEKPAEEEVIEDEPSEKQEPEKETTNDKKSDANNDDTETDEKGEKNEEPKENDEDTTNEKPDEPSDDREATDIADAKLKIKVAKILKVINDRIENEVQKVEATLTVVSEILSRDLVNLQPDLSSYSNMNQNFFDDRQLPSGNLDFFNGINILEAYDRDIYGEENLQLISTMVGNDPVVVYEKKMKEIQDKKLKVYLELKEMLDERASRQTN